MVKTGVALSQVKESMAITHDFKGDTYYHQGEELFLCTVCLRLESDHSIEPIPVLSPTPHWDYKSLLWEKPEGKVRNIFDDIKSWKLLWRIKRRKQVWGRQPEKSGPSSLVLRSLYKLKSTVLRRASGKTSA
jgi:hypothetical protein